jgi:hypothetical protein
LRRKWRVKPPASVIIDPLWDEESASPEYPDAMRNVGYGIVVAIAAAGYFGYTKYPAASSDSVAE